MILLQIKAQGSVMFLSDGRTFKDVARRQVFNVAPKHSLLLLPGYHCEDIKLALRLGVISKETKCIFVEQDKEIFAKICGYVKTQWPYKWPKLYNCELHRISINDSIDFAFVDLCGNLLCHDALWIFNQIAPNLTPGADLAFTFTLHTRNNKFIKECIKSVIEHYPDLIASLPERLLHVVKQVPLMATYLVLFYHVFFPRHSFGISMTEYRDEKSGYAMILIQLKNMQPQVGMNSKLEAQLGAPRVKLSHSFKQGVFLMATATKKKSKTTTTENGKSIAQAFVAATTPAQTAAATRRLKALQKRREAEGADPKMVKAGIDSWVTRLKSANAKSAKKN